MVRELSSDTSGKEAQAERKQNEHQPAEAEDLIASFSRPLQDLEDALDAQRANERDVFRELVDENARLKREAARAQESAQEARLRNEVLTSEFEEEKRSLKTQLEEMSKDMRELMQKRKKKGAPVDDVTPAPFTSDEQAQQVKQLRKRLQLLSEELSVKDEQLAATQMQLDEARTLLLKLQALVDAEEVEKLKQEIEENRKRRARRSQKDNVVTDRAPAQSAACNVM